MSKFLSVLILVISFQIHAGIVLVPFLGYEQASLSVTDITGDSGTYKDSGPIYGARVGYKFGQAFWAAGEYTAGSGKSKVDNSSAAERDITKTIMGLVLGYDFGRVNVWAGYGSSDKLAYKEADGSTFEFTGGNTKIGIGYEAAMHVAINLEYIIPKYTKFSAPGIGLEGDISTVYPKLDVSAIALSVSFPFEFGK